MQPDDAYWRRPAETNSPEDPAQRSSLGGPEPAMPGNPTGMPNLIYQGPPVWSAPPADWRPAHVVEPAPPRRLPEQNHAAIDDQEARARTLSLGLAIVASAIMVIVLCAMCGRNLF